ncbi:hypothetical protein I4F81_009813 [Pyropia yezoensis]|uniref:Uncharacterized protein n=1 Tax=Pyropia yezoensis TaxID=2788 RepID=A0ACC3CBZ6_PYRYE|nr:hypothetical protein I4F81_009813 [Neopyropia yezoensis]
MSQTRQRRGGGGDGAPRTPDGGDSGGSSDGGGGGGEALGGDSGGGSLPVRLARQCWGHLVVLKYRYDLHTALYMLDPWERALFNTVLLVILAWSARLAAGSLFGGGSPAASQ